MLLWDPPLPCFSSFVNDENSIFFLTPSPPIVLFSLFIQFFFWMSSLRNKYHLSVIHFLRIIFESLSAFPWSMLIQFSLVTKWRPVLLHFLRLLWTMTKPAETGAEVATDYNCGWVLTLSLSLSHSSLSTSPVRLSYVLQYPLYGFF